VISILTSVNKRLFESTIKAGLGFYLILGRLGGLGKEKEGSAFAEEACQKRR
jgi:hypothetical protein